MGQKTDFGTSSAQQRISGINWNQVYYFSLVAANGSIKGAAESIDLSPSTLSEHISELEKDLNVELFRRQGRKLSLTEQGERLYHHAKAMFENGHRLLDVVSPNELGNYPISIGLLPGPHLEGAYSVIGDFLEKFGSQEMKIRHCTPDELENGLASARLDFGFADRPPKRKDLTSHCVASKPIRFYVSNEWQGFKFAEILEKVPLLVCRSESSIDAFIEKVLQEADLQPSAIISSDFPSVLMNLCRRGLGVGAFCESKGDALPEDSVRTLRNPKDAPVLETCLYAVWSPLAENSAAVCHLKRLLTF
jgi:LysR family transcriptional activator of nhaA